MPVPAALVPILLPSTTLPVAVALASTTPPKALSEIRFPVDAAVPPIVLLGEKASTPLEFPLPVTPSGSTPM